MKVYGVIPAAGVGRRFGAAIPKQYQLLAGKTILEHSIAQLQSSQELAGLWVALNPDDQCWSSLHEDIRNSVKVVTGGAERADSVRLAIHQISDASDSDWVLVHDAVRPLVDPGTVGALIQSLGSEEAGAILALPIYETVKQAHANQTVAATLDRSSLWTAQTPQVFRYGLLKQSLEATKGDRNITDEASAMEACGHSVRLHQGHRNNIKITAREDLLLAEQILRAEAAR